MGEKRFWFLLLLFQVNNAIKPSNFNNKKRKFIPNKNNPSSDLKVISLSEASIISKHWLININEGKLKNCDHIIDKINKSEEFFQKQYSEESKFNDLYLAWAPKGEIAQVSYIVISTVDHEDKKLIVNILIPSPNWNTNQISNLELKKSLMDLAYKSEAELDLTPLYDSDIRIKLDWTLFKS